MADKKAQLATIANEISHCQKCPLFQAATNPVPGEGNPDSLVFFVGEAPGYYEDQQGRPFVGRAGKLLDEALAKIGMTRGEVFISNVLHHRPPSNRDPLPNEVEVCKSYVMRQLEIIQPEILATLGRFAMNLFLPDAKISQAHGMMKRTDGPAPAGQDKFDFVIFPLYHPAAALRSTKIKEDFLSDFEKLGKLVKMKNGEVTALMGRDEEDMKTEQMGLF
ncbi:uracil-DNA glycosylase [Patescibacteria group bacterium]|nr:uracil-DNA glycosylase [Patescibacteria group bacterium]